MKNTADRTLCGAEKKVQSNDTTLRGSLQLFKADLLRRFEIQEVRTTLWAALCAMTRPGVLAVLLWRLGNWLYLSDRRVAARLLERVNVFVARSELQVGARVGPGLVISDEGTVGVTGSSCIGSNCTLLGLVAIICHSGDFITLGDNCVIGRRARLFGTISLANGSLVKANSLVVTSCVREGAVLSGVPARRRYIVPYERIASWNPIKGRRLRRP